MITSILQRIKPVATLLAAVSLVTFGLSGCGSGGGGDDAATQPAPQTFNGLVLTLYTQGVTLTFLRSGGDAANGIENGAVTMTANPAATGIVDANGVPGTLRPSTQINGTSYTYVRTSPEGGTLTLTGSGSGIFLLNGLPVPSTYFATVNFNRQYDVLFGTDGATINGVNVNDSGEGVPYPGITWIGSTLRLYGGGAVPIGWSVKASEGLNLPKIYPDSVNKEAFVVVPDDLLQDSYNHQFLNSTFTRFSDERGDFIEEGVGNRNIVDDNVLTLINFDYQPDPNTANLAKIRIYEDGGATITYNLTFVSLEAGTYVRDDGSTGTFEFPYLE